MYVVLSAGFCHCKLPMKHLTSGVMSSGQTAGVCTLCLKKVPTFKRCETQAQLTGGQKFEFLIFRGSVATRLR